MTDDKSIQDKIADAMPPIPEDRAIEGGIRMTHEEQDTLNQNLDAMIHALLDKGYTPSDLHVVFSGFEHRLNAQQYDPHEYDRIALSLQVRKTIEDWRDEQDGEVPDMEIARALRDQMKVYRENGLQEFYKEQGRKEAQNDE
jgi:hypothetical protein